MFGETKASRGTFVFGILCGFGISFLLLVTCFTSLSTFRKTNTPNTLRSFLNIRSRMQVMTIQKDMHDIMDRNLRSVKPVLVDDSHFHHDDNSVAKDLEKNIRVLCWIMTGPQNLDKKAIHVKKTWAKRCNILIFISSVTNTSFPTVGLNISEGREHLTGKTMQAFRYVYEHYKDQADWFMKADDDTFVILENLRYFLKDYKPSDPVYFGQLFNLRNFVKQGYYSGGAGYVLSKEALTRLVAKGKNKTLCQQDGGNEDVEIGRCLENLGVKTLNSTDALGRTRFHCFDPETHLFGLYPDWFVQRDASGAKKGTESMSDYAISFHYVPPQKMYALEFFVYHLRPYGIQSGHQHLNLLDGR
ncbi:glycoprotein-N-acetylgalactosamine 3-beta-galactosyltransferase 1-like isoform X1 [Mytilus galloprovincialis]|uniref:glycoprotein-N-acetylgalactosamine 3-beta-galactosyltransferase 1-like isoform X1 n=2 Tax=Mytilus galloprovincialis TaxID=29158 RepID=UPI003F7C040D